MAATAVVGVLLEVHQKCAVVQLIGVSFSSPWLVTNFRIIYLVEWCNLNHLGLKLPLLRPFIIG